MPTKTQNLDFGSAPTLEMQVEQRVYSSLFAQFLALFEKKLKCAENLEKK